MRKQKPFQNLPIPFLAVMLGIGLSMIWNGCAKSPPPFVAYSEKADAGGMDLAMVASEERQAAPQSYMTTSSVSRSKTASFSSKEKAWGSANSPSAPVFNHPNVTQAPKPSAKRMVHYSGRATLKSTEPEKVLDSAIALVQAAGGFLEQRSPSFVALRVPAADFDSLFNTLMKLATVLDYSQEAEDITEAFNDTDLRLKIVVSTLNRLEELVKKARTESQKLRLLKELQRYREEREILEARKQDLVQRARFASIHLTVQTYAPWASQNAWRLEIRDLKWIHQLNPFADSRFRGRDNQAFPVPEKMVVSQKKNPWRATSSHGSEFWGSEMDVSLCGDSRFWREAIRVRLKEGYKTADTLIAGDFQFAHFKSFGPEPYFYWVGVRSVGDEIKIAEFYFPNEMEQTQLLPSLLAAVEGQSK
jgi:Domain of unknown function (DUF4349)